MDITFDNEQFNMLLSKISSENNYLIIIIVPAILIFVTTIGNIISNKILSSQELKNESKHLKLERKLEKIEKLYSELVNIRTNSLDGASNKKKILSKINEIRKFIELDEIIITENIHDKSCDILDYFTQIIDFPETRNLKTENKLFNDFIAIYEKL